MRRVGFTTKGVEGTDTDELSWSGRGSHFRGNYRSSRTERQALLLPACDLPTGLARSCGANTTCQPAIEAELFDTRFNLRSLLGTVAFIAAALASLMQPWRSWCPALLLTATVFLLLLAIPASVFAAGRERAFYVGFAIVGWGYVILASAPAFDVMVGRQMLAMPIAESACLAVTGSLGDIEQFLKVTHILFTCCLAYAGGVVTGRCYLRANKLPANATRRPPFHANDVSMRRAQ